MSIIQRIEEAVFKVMDNGKVHHIALSFDDYGALMMTGSPNLYMVDGKPEYASIKIKKTKGGSDKSFVMKMDNTREYI